MSATSQSALHTGGPVAETLLGVSTVLTVGATSIFVGVMALLWLA
ncbi:MAG: cytochrome C oxidase subunit II, partial [Variovorax sp.]